MFVIPSFEIHGSVKGLFDLGPPACGLKANIIDIWRKHFVLTENMLEVPASPYPKSCWVQNCSSVFALAK
jgi:glycyl-tRNA synthetase (class II)